MVSVCTPTGRHGEIAIEALEAGKHVIIEKPAETTVAKIDEIIARSAAAGTQVAVISQHRFDPPPRWRWRPSATVSWAGQRHRLDRLVARADATTTPETGVAPGSSTGAAR